MQLKSGFKFLSYLKDGSVTPYVRDEGTTSKWVYFGADNLFPDAMLTLADNCVPLGRCVQMAAMYIAGKGVKFKDQEGNELEAAQAKFQELLKDTTEEEFLYATAFDIATMNALSWNVRRAAGGAIARLDHIDVSRVRSGRKNMGKVENYYFSSDWSRVGTRGGAEERYRPIELPAFVAGKATAPTELLYVKQYKPGRDYYGEPWYLPCVPDAEVWAKVPVFNRTQIDTGFKPGVHIHLPIDADPKDIAQQVDDLRDSYMGASAEGAFITFGRTPEEVVKVEPMPRGDHAGELDAIRDNAEKVIVRGYGIPDLLYRMDTSGGLTSQGSALKAALEQFQTTFVEPKQQMITSQLVRIMNELGIEVWECEIEELEPFEDDQQSDVIKMAVMTTDELRDEMDLPPLEDERGIAIPGTKAPTTPATPPAQPPVEPTPTPEEE